MLFPDLCPLSELFPRCCLSWAGILAALLGTPRCKCSCEGAGACQPEEPTHPTHILLHVRAAGRGAAENMAWHRLAGVSENNRAVQCRAAEPLAPQRVLRADNLHRAAATSSALTVHTNRTATNRSLGQHAAPWIALLGCCCRALCNALLLERTVQPLEWSLALLTLFLLLSMPGQLMKRQLLTTPGTPRQSSLRDTALRGDASALSSATGLCSPPWPFSTSTVTCLKKLGNDDEPLPSGRCSTAIQQQRSLRSGTGGSIHPFLMPVGSSISGMRNVKMKLLLPFLGLDPGITWSSLQMIKYVLLGACLGF